MNRKQAQDISIDYNSGYMINDDEVCYYELQPLFKYISILEIIDGSEQDTL